MIGPILSLFPLTWPEPLRKAAAWASIAVAAFALLWAAKAAYDASVIDDHETDRAVESMDAHNQSAEQRAIDAVVNIVAENERERAVAAAEASEAAKPVEQRAKLPPTTRALNCARMRQAYTKAELERMAEFKRECG